MIYNNGHELVNRFLNGKAATAVYKGAVLVWEAIRSCFGKGYWIPERPWIEKDIWKNS